MNEEPSLVVVCYDTPSNRRRRRLVRLASDMTDRVQKSVFEGRLTEQQRHLLWARLAAAVHSEEDSLRLYSLCERCRRQSHAIGVAFMVKPNQCWLL
jgi:CRISPR-associated protein Cas2